MRLEDVIRGPVLTEKSEWAREKFGAYTFEVDRRATKDDIKAAIERFFGVDVVDVRTQIVRGKNKRVGRFVGRRPNWKKAIVVLKEGQSIDLFDLGV